MADAKISALPEVTDLAASDLIPVVASSTTSRITRDNFKSEIGINVAAVEPTVAAFLASPSTYTEGDRILIPGAGVLVRLADSATEGHVTRGSEHFDAEVSHGILNAQLVGATGSGLDGDAATNVTALNTAITAVYDAGGGIVFVPKGHYKTNDNVRLKDGVHLYGEGYGTRIDNIALAAAGFGKCVIVSGNIGDTVGSNGIYEETSYDIQAITPGETEVTLSTSGDASNFSVGEIVAISSYETWSGSSPDNFPKYNNVNEIVSISGGVIELKHHIPDSYPSASGNPVIRRVTGSLNGYDGNASFWTKNCGVENMRLTQATGQTSGWYALFPCGINQRYERLWFDDCSSMIGTNALAHSVCRDWKGRFEAGFLDFAFFQNDNLIENIHGTRFAANASLNRIGISVHAGSDITLRNIHGALGYGGTGYGKYSLHKVHRGTYDDVVIIDAGEDEAIVAGFGDDVVINRAHIINPHENGVVLSGGPRARVTNCTIPSVGTGGYSVYALAAVDTCYVHDNQFGTKGAFTIYDRFIQSGGPSENAVVKDNVGYISGAVSDGKINNAEFAQTSQTGSYATIRSTTIEGSSGIRRAFRVFASGARSGVNSTKTVQLVLGSTVLTQLNYGASDTSAWVLEAVINISDGDSVRAASWGAIGSAYQANLDIIASGLTSDADVKIEGQVANASDAVVIYQFVVEEIAA